MHGIKCHSIHFKHLLSLFDSTAHHYKQYHHHEHGWVSSASSITAPLPVKLFSKKSIENRTYLVIDYKRLLMKSRVLGRD